MPREVSFARQGRRGNLIDQNHGARLKYSHGTGSPCPSIAASFAADACRAAGPRDGCRSFSLSILARNRVVPFAQAAHRLTPTANTSGARHTDVSYLASHKRAICADRRPRAALYDNTIIREGVRCDPAAGCFDAVAVDPDTGALWTYSDGHSNADDDDEDEYRSPATRRQRAYTPAGKLRLEVSNHQVKNEPATALRVDKHGL